MVKPTAFGDVTIAGVSLWSLGTFEEFGGALETQPRRGSGYVLPGAVGEVAVTRPRASYEVSFGLTLYSDQTTESAALTDLASKWASLESALAGDTFTVVKKLGTYSKSATCTDGHAVPTFDSPYTARVTVSFKVISAWT